MSAGNTPSRRLRLNLRTILACLLMLELVAAGVVRFTPVGQRVSAWAAQVTDGSRAPAAPPMIFGTNMTLYDSYDQVLNRTSTQQLLKQARLPIMRMPFRSARGNVDEIRALRAIQYIGATPVVIVHGATDHAALADDSQLIQIVRNIFGDAPVYVEFGNEPDLAGIDARAYASAWNTVIPALKAIAPAYKFIGPSTSAAEPAYIGEFDRLAKPRPDANAWHEYACTPSSSNETCMAAVSKWSDHVQWVNDAVHKAIGTRLPLMITEWNLAADPDQRFANPTFMSTWTALAVQTLTENMAHGLHAALQYCITNNGYFDLIAPDDSLTPEGREFFAALARSDHVGA